MSVNLDKSLDDIISSHKGAGARGRGGRGGARSTNARRPPPSRPQKSTPYARPKAASQPMPKRGNLDEPWKHDLWADSASSRRGGSSGSAYNNNHRNTGPSDGTKIRIEGLHYNVTESDLRDLLSLVGPLKFSRIHYDASGRSEGSADAVFLDAATARAAVAKYNGVALDGETMKFAVVGGDGAAGGGGGARAAGGGRPSVLDRLGKRTGGAPIDVDDMAVDGDDDRRWGGGADRRGRRGAAGARGGGRSGGGGRPTRPAREPREPKQPKKNVSAEGLDADLDAYMQGTGDAMDADKPAAAPAAQRQVVTYDDL